jgi:ABC-type glycerol-3-phosphate transport system permease component
MRPKLGPSTIIGMIAILIWCLLPVAWIVSLSFKSVEETATGSPQFLPKDPTFAVYQEVFANPDFQRALINSFGISLIATTLSVILATLAAYASPGSTSRASAWSCRSLWRSRCSRWSRWSAHCSTSGGSWACSTPGPA